MHVTQEKHEFSPQKKREEKHEFLVLSILGKKMKLLVFDLKFH